MRPAQELLFGSAAPLPERIPLRAGPLELTYEAGDLRAISLDGVAIVNRIYGAVRNRDWATVPGHLSECSMSVDARSFEVRYHSTHDDQGVAFAWQARISGSADGTVAFAFEGAATGPCASNRIGVCVLHPLSAAGLSVQVTTTRGVTRRATFPELVAIEQPIVGFTEIASLCWSPVAGIEVELQLEGDVFETEDQRNWIDASYKTYSTPLHLPRPRILAAGDRVAQRATVRLRQGSHPGPRPRPRLVERRSAPGPMTVGLVAGRVPSRSSRAQAPLVPSHLRVDLAPGGDWEAALAHGIAEAVSYGCPIELALTVNADAVPFLRQLARSLPLAPGVCRVLVSDAGAMTTTAGALRLVHAHLAAARPDCGPVAAGSARDLYQLHLAPPPHTGTVFWGMHPQAHATDLSSIAETPIAAGHQLQAMRVRRPEARVAISPLRFHPDGKDARAHSLFGGAWTFSVLAELSGAGCDSVTIDDSPFCADDGRPLPLYFVLADVLETASADDTVVRPGIGVTGLLRDRTLLLANTGRQVQTVDVPAQFSPRAFRVLDLSTLAAAAREPEVFRNTFRQWEGSGHLALEPGAFARIDGKRAR